MTKRTRVTLLACFGPALAIAAILAIVYAATKKVPEFYVEALHVDTAHQSRASHQFLASSASVASAVHKQERWQARITAAQINGWLAVDRVQNHPDLLPPEVIDPRVAVEPRRAVIAFRFDDGNVSTVVSIEFEAAMQEPGVIALHICKARAGALPIPLGKVIDTISTASADFGLHLRWLETEGNPTALISIPESQDDQSSRFQLDVLELRDGAIILSGGSRQPFFLDAAAKVNSVGRDPAGQSPSNATRQR